MTLDKKLLEKHGIDNRFVRNIGLSGFRSDGGSRKHAVKVYIPKHSLESFQVFSLYLKLIGYGVGKKNPFSSWVKDKIQEDIERLTFKKDPIFEEARKLLKELRLKQHIEDLETDEDSIEQKI